MLETPYRLTAFTVAAILLSGAGFVCGNLRSVYSSLPLLAACFAGVVIGVLGMYWAAYILREGVRNERWSERTLAPFRRITDHVLWKIGMVGLVVAMLAALTQDRHHRSWFWPVFFILQTQTQINTAFARPRKAAGSGTRPDWSQIPPLQSEYWGER